MKIGILIPFRGTQKDKSRLRLDLDDILVDSLLNESIKHVLKEVANLEMEKTIYLLTKKEDIDFAEKSIVIKDQSNNLNIAIDKALREMDEETIIIIMADLPLINTESITKIIKLHEVGEKIILAPTLDNGTSILCFNRNDKFPFLFGINSSLRFKEAFKKESLNFEILIHQNVYKDMDTLKDLIELSELNFIPDWLEAIFEKCGLYE
jgi:2-phospho-L-lactate guanylyltransferase